MLKDGTFFSVQNEDRKMLEHVSEWTLISAVKARSKCIWAEREMLLMWKMEMRIRN